jgi:hypothetical protein
MNAAEPVGFITVEDDGEDLILSFAVELDEPGEVASVILMRTPKYEVLLPREERGVTVSHELHEQWDDEALRRLRWADDRVEIATNRSRYVLDVSRVDPEELRDGREMLRRMNFDGRFELEFG